MDIQELADEFTENALNDVAEHLREHGVEATVEYVEAEIAEAKANPGSFLSGDPNNLEVALDRLEGIREEVRDQKLLDAAADLTAALRALYRINEGDEGAVGEIEYECHKVARQTYLDSDNGD